MAFNISHLPGVRELCWKVAEEDVEREKRNMEMELALNVLQIAIDSK
jgi:hypothetical protein